ncbi:hypothetical protein AX774_g2202 [Zancudomyces culisetae]|uniref:Uncharacterized protein n=1 Tax=Zancudomyces culisetae TaxID=1213189 RepID=A0A1R1PTK2_ZANCU|nr:hypothetical protein AX774_g2202 [Zancudomyces culisetae]|eukprot:OMH84281.1 hypothetical protein AX774_g2202 [Zancudomyces culisetae]
MKNTHQSQNRGYHQFHLVPALASISGIFARALSLPNSSIRCCATSWFLMLHSSETSGESNNPTVAPLSNNSCSISMFLFLLAIAIPSNSGDVKSTPASIISLGILTPSNSTAVLKQAILTDFGYLSMISFFIAVV